MVRCKRIGYAWAKAGCVVNRFLGLSTREDYAYRKSELRRLFFGAPMDARCLREPQCWGDEYADLGFLVIRRSGDRVGLFLHYITNLGWVWFAQAHGLVPVVDMRTTNNLYSMGDDNPWEHFFSQPGGFSLDDIARARRVYVSDEIPPVRPDDRMGFLMGREIAPWRRLARRCMSPSAAVMAEVRRNEATMFKGSRNVLGVLLRGTDYMALKPAGHPVQPDLEHSVRDVAKAVEAGRYEHLFLATEDATIAARYREVFGAALHMTDAPSIDYEPGRFLGDLSGVRGNAKIAMDYCVRIVILSRCRSLMAGRTSGAVAATVMSDGFEYEHYWDLGRYPFPRS